MSLTDLCVSRFRRSRFQYDKSTLRTAFDTGRPENLPVGERCPVIGERLDKDRGRTRGQRVVKDRWFRIERVNRRGANDRETGLHMWQSGLGDPKHRVYVGLERRFELFS